MTQQRYRLIADELEGEIAGMAPGSKLDSEHTLMKRFGVGRAAARAAVQELERRLRVRRVQGAGTFVTKRIDYVISRDRPPSWHRTVREAGAHPRSVVLDRAIEPLPADCAVLLEAPVGTPTHRMVRMSYIDDVVAGTAVEWIVHDAVPDLADAMRVEESLDEVLRQVGHVEAVRSWCRTASDIPPPDVQQRLELATAVPVWVVESVNRDPATGRPLTYSTAWMRGDAVRVVMEIGSTGAPDGAPSRTPAPDTKEVAWK
ncbi:GntR family transcriptional regulator [Rhodococcus triatomae]|uniref:DNA-binding transcriptional regulator, GntR family n=1 Tax=Rhodococcus triatomae TaxID=300028 RepID=A0A1G8QNL3_9NOCA|nr:GntR family transcriptional regulator [Rhodococcus triatomae]QNG20616.1 GntR family transcriptional regulator [Rhodococcus triatomae]QNG23466.1 GntR family transcriptional regulator [Rhodococcus triatomae]SDJ06297.1 DNA-binding transcriptional regulator, GntR family [Rhodococcus triatomae]